MSSGWLLGLIAATLALAGCEGDRLSKINDPERNDPIDDPRVEDPMMNEIPTDVPIEELPWSGAAIPTETPIEQLPVTIIPPIDPPIVGTLQCLDGSIGVSWHDTLPTLPPVVQPGAALLPGSGLAAATCVGDAAVLTNSATTQSPISAFAHVGGQWYFEAVVRRYEPGWSKVGIFASPSDVWHLDNFSSIETSAAGTSVSQPGALGVAADLDAGRAYFYVDGVLSGDAPLLLLPGVGAFHAGGVSMIGNEIKFNFGSDPFAFDPPAGYEAWSSGRADPTGACLSDADVPAPAAAVAIRCDGNALCSGPTTFESSTNEDTQLVVLGAYDSGSVSSWEWGQDANGNWIEVPIGPGRNGSVLVELNREGRIALVLSAYEPTDWTLLVGPNTELASVSLYGMHLQTIAGVAPGVPLEIHTICTGGNGGNCPGVTGDNFPIAPYQWPYSTGGGDTQGFIDEMEALFCLPLKVFAAAYEARRFTVD